MRRNAFGKTPKLRNGSRRVRKPISTDMDRKVRSKEPDEIGVSQKFSAFGVVEEAGEMVRNASFPSRRSGMFVVPDAERSAAMRKALGQHERQPCGDVLSALCADGKSTQLAPCVLANGYVRRLDETVCFSVDAQGMRKFAEEPRRQRR